MAPRTGSSSSSTNRKRNIRKRAPRRKNSHGSEMEDATPTEEEWATLRRVAGFTVDVIETGPGLDGEDNDSTANEERVKTVTFMKGDDAIICSPKDGTNDIWVARIKQIRCRPNYETWVRVLWYWSPNDISQRMKSFNAACCAPHERIPSDLSDIISAHCFAARTHVFEYDEDSINPPDIVRGDFFSRPSFFNHKKRTLDPKIGSTTCFCYQPYNPFPTCTLSSDDSMHFCSRKDCLRWYHTSCLVKRGFVDPQFEVYQGTSDLQQLTADSERDLRYQGDRGLRLLAVDPGSDAPCILLQYFVEPAEEALKVEHASACSDSDSGRGSSPLSDLPLSMQPLTVLVTLAEALQVMSYSPTTLAHLPPALLRIAQFPIVRRPAPPDSDCSPIGNVNEVVLARRFVYAAFEGARPDGEWAHAVEHLIKQVESIECGGRPKVDGLMNGNAEHEAKNEEDLEDEKIEVLQSIVERLTEDILLASPYLPYWEQRARELEKEELEMGPPLVCPNCLGAI